MLYHIIGISSPWMIFLQQTGRRCKDGKESIDPHRQQAMVRHDCGRKKNEEYRTIKGYWVKRLFLLWNEDTCTNEKIPTHCVKNWDSISPEMANYCINSPYYKAIPYTHVLFINGYRKDSPRIEKEIESITIGKPKKVFAPTSGLILSFYH